jgi:hypothetical protein
VSSAWRSMDPDSSVTHLFSSKLPAGREKSVSIVRSCYAGDDCPAHPPGAEEGGGETGDDEFDCLGGRSLVSSAPGVGRRRAVAVTGGSHHPRP